MAVKIPVEVVLCPRLAIKTLQTKVLSFKKECHDQYATGLILQIFVLESRISELSDVCIQAGIRKPL